MRGFTPDQPPQTPGILTDCTQWIPFDTGFESAPQPSAQGSAALAAECQGAFLGEKLDASVRVFAGTASELYELSGTTWSSVKHGAGVYSIGTDRWSFAQFGDATLVATPTVLLQQSSSGAFADIAGSPKATTIATMMIGGGGGFVVAGNTDAGKDVWICSALNDATSSTAWTPSSATQCTTGRILSDDGQIRCMREFGASQIVAYKQRSMYVGDYVGTPEVIRFRKIPKVGALGPEAVANLGYAHVFAAYNDIYLFDGNVPRSIAGGQVREWYTSNLSATFAHRTQVVWDVDRNIVWIYFPDSSSSGKPNRTLVWSPTLREWGRADQIIEAALFYSSPAISWAAASGTWASYAGTWSDSPASTRSLATIDSTHTMQLINGPSTTSDFTLHDIGDDEYVSRLTELRLRYSTRPTSALLALSRSFDTGTGFTAGPTVSALDIPSSALSRFPTRQTAKWHRSRVQVTGATSVTGYEPFLVPVGRR